jgi:transglutaminase-like putative cysteine protease
MCKGSNMKIESNDLNDYLRVTEIIDWNNPNILSKAKEIIGGETDKITKIKLLFEWVRDEVPHSKDINSDIVTCTASEVLRVGTGICYAKSHLLAALLRANGIPSGFCYQVLQRDPPFEGLVLHGLNGIFVEDINKWVRVDSRGNTGSCNAQFDIEKEQLAFSMNKNLGEFIYETIFIDPDPNIISILKRFKNRNEMWCYLPNKLAKDGST